MLTTEDSSFIRITPQGSGRACISSYYNRPAELREELQRVAYDIYYAINVCHYHMFLSFSKGMKDIEVHSVFGKDKKFKYDVVVHGFESTYDLIDFLCQISNATIGGQNPNQMLYIN